MENPHNTNTIPSFTPLKNLIHTQIDSSTKLPVTYFNKAPLQDVDSNLYWYNWWNVRLYAIHFLAMFFLLIMFVFAYIKLMYPFWNSQPVFHTYDFWRYWTSIPFIIMHKKGQGIKPSKFCDFDHVLTLNYLDMPTDLKSDLIDFLQCHYISDETVLFLFHKENLDAYHSGHLFPSYVSFYMSTYSDLDSGHNMGIVQKKRIEACIISRSVSLKFFRGANADDRIGVRTIYFMDFIALRRGSDITFSRKLMATHCWRTLEIGSFSQLLDNDNHDIKGAIFRKEGIGFVGIRPFFSFDAHLYKIDGSFTKPLLPIHFSVVNIHDKNVELFTDFLDSIFHSHTDNDHSLVVVSSIPNLMDLVKRRVLFIYLIVRNSECFCLYLFRDTRTQYDFANGDNGALLQFVCSIQKSNSYELFYRGFLNSLHDILNHGSGKIFRYLMVDDMGDNRSIISEFPASAFLEKIAVNYYGYNLVMPTVTNALFLV